MNEFSTVSIDTEIRDKLKIEAVKEGKSIKDLIKKIVDLYFEQKKDYINKF
jgi:hypothetical protein